MKSRLKIALTSLIFMLFVVVSGVVYAASFSLTKIGALETQGNVYSEWWYTRTNPVLAGTGTPSDSLTITVDGGGESVTVDTEGNWTYPLYKEAGDYVISISDGVDTYTFTLHLGQSFPADGTTTATTTTTTTTTQTTQSTAMVPDTGLNQTTALAFGIGISLLALYFYINGEKDKKHLFEKNISSDR